MPAGLMLTTEAMIADVQDRRRNGGMGSMGMEMCRSKLKGKSKEE